MRQWLETIAVAAFVIFVLAFGGHDDAYAQTQNVPNTGALYRGPATPVFCVNPVTSATAPCASNGAISGSTTPAAGTAHAIVTGGTALTAVTGPVNGCYIVNPLSATDEGISTVEPLYVNPVTTATTTGNSTTAALQPGQTFTCVPGQSTSVSVNATTTSHAFVVVKW